MLQHLFFNNLSEESERLFFALIAQIYLCIALTYIARCGIISPYQVSTSFEEVRVEMRIAYSNETWNTEKGSALSPRRSLLLFMPQLPLLRNTPTLRMVEICKRKTDWHGSFVEYPHDLLDRVTKEVYYNSSSGAYPHSVNASGQGTVLCPDEKVRFWLKMINRYKKR